MLKKFLKNKPALDTSKFEKYPDVVVKHLNGLKGTGFESCAACPGTTGKVVEHEDTPKMLCTRCGATGVHITAAQANHCDGSSPVRHRSNKKHRHFLPVQQSLALL